MSKVASGKPQHRSLRGKIVDMELLRKRNELTPAVGNAKVNARGDELGPNGTILRKREEVVSDHYANAGTATHSQPPEIAVQAEVQAEPVAKKTAKKVKVKQDPVAEAAPDLSKEEEEMMNEAAAEDEWVEDADGNFVQKGS
jgi:hypothetical protein